MRMKPSAFLVALLAVATPSSVSSQLSIPKALRQTEFPLYLPVSVSSDGSSLAFTTQNPMRLPRSDGEYGLTGVPNQYAGSDVWVQSIKGGKAKLISGGSGSSWAPSWAPNGDDLVFYSDRDGSARLWLWNRSTGKLSRVSASIVRAYAGYHTPKWTSGGSAVVTRIVAEGESAAEANVRAKVASSLGDNEVKEDGSTVSVFRSEAAQRRIGQVVDTNNQFEMGNSFAYVADLAVVSVGTGEVRRISHGVQPLQYWVSPDGKKVAFATLGPYLPKSGLTSDVFLWDGSQTRRIASSVPLGNYGRNLAWSPDSTAFAFERGGDSDAGVYLYRLNEMRLHRVSLSWVPSSGFRSSFFWGHDGQAILAVRDRAIDLLNVQTGRVRSFEAPIGKVLGGIVADHGSSVMPKADADEVIVATRDVETKMAGFSRLDLVSGKFHTLFEERKQHDLYGGAGFAIAGNGQEFLYFAQDAFHPSDIWLSDKAGSNRRKVSDLNPQLSGLRYGKPRLISWKTADGGDLKGTLLLPVGYRKGQRVPLVVYGYPLDQRSENIYSYGVTGAGVENMQLFATRGIAILAPDIALDSSNQRRSLTASIISAVDAVVAAGIADPDRLGIMGHSWGGYMAITLLTASERFKAAVARGSLSNYISMYGLMEPNGSARGIALLEGMYGGSLWEKKEQYLEDSPVLFLDKVRTPLLLVHGGSDANAFPILGQETFVDLRRLGQDVELAQYEGENHGEVTWSYPNKVDFITRVLAWFEGHLTK